MAGRGKRRSSNRKGGGLSPLGWFLSGLVLGLGGAIFLYTSGFMPPAPERVDQDDDPAATASGELLEDTAADAARYDFFTVLPEMEVVVPERELSSRALPATDGHADDGAQKFILQAGSFRSAADADQMKARLALLGSVASIQQVTVNNETWHRVRIGPVSGARQADQLRRQLQDNGIEVLVLKDSS